MAIEHDFFGLIESSPDGSIFWSEMVELGEQAVTVDLTAPEQDAVSSEALDVAAELILSLDAVDLRARNAMIAELSDRTSEVIEFLFHVEDNYGDDLVDLLVNPSGDTHVDVIASLVLVSMTVLADAYQAADGPFVVLEYGLNPDADEQMLLVNLDMVGAVIAVTSADE